MGPRLISRGGRQDQHGHADLCGASMGPRLISRGDGRQTWPTMRVGSFNGAAAELPRRLPEVLFSRVMSFQLQ